MADQQTQQLTATDILRLQHERVKSMFEELASAPTGASSELFDCLRAMLAVHETGEEMVVHPRARTIGPEGERILQARLDEESEAKRMLSDLEKLGPDGEGFGTMLAKFKAAVLAHAEAEETQVFPLLEKNLEEDELRKMGDALRAAETMAPTHPHPHGPETATGNALVGPFVAMVDKVRDALKSRAA